MSEGESSVIRGGPSAARGDGDHHTPFDLPVALVVGGAGRLAGNRHLKYPLHTP